jgi:hypothetical protein
VKYYLNGLMMRESTGEIDQERAMSFLAEHVKITKGETPLIAIGKAWQKGMKIYMGLEKDQRKRFNLITKELWIAVSQMNMLLSEILKTQKGEPNGREDQCQ